MIETQVFKGWTVACKGVSYSDFRHLKILTLEKIHLFFLCTLCYLKWRQ